MNSLQKSYDAVVVGAGPNGLAAAIELQRAGRAVLLLEGAREIGGGVRSAELTLPGFVSDVCSAVYPMGIGSPFFRTLPLADHGLSWIQPPVAAAHPLADGTCALLRRSVDDTAAGLQPDAAAYRRLLGFLAAGWDKLAGDALGPLRLPRHPLLMARFGLLAIRSAQGLLRARFTGPHARALLAGTAAHSMLPLSRPPTAAVALMLAASGHAVGWPQVRGGARNLSGALGSYFRSLGGEVLTGTPVTSLDSLPPSRVVLLDVTPRQLLHLGGDRLSPRYRRRLRAYRYGPGAFKIDWALDGPIPWRAAECAQAGTVHVGGTLEEVALAEHQAATGVVPERPFVLLGQPSHFDEARAPAGKHVVWAYCHVPHGATADMTARIEAQVERFAPGFRDRILGRHVMGPAQLEAHNPNLVGGDLGGGVMDLRQLFSRPVSFFSPYATSDPRLFLCSSSTPPGTGVHGMCGYFAARAALRQ